MKRHLAPLLMLLTLFPIVFASPPPNSLDRPKPTVPGIAPEYPQIFKQEDLEKLGLERYPWIHNDRDWQWGKMKIEIRMRTRHKHYKIRMLYEATEKRLLKAWRVIVSTLRIGD